MLFHTHTQFRPLDDYSGPIRATHSGGMSASDSGAMSATCQRTNLGQKKGKVRMFST
jgi:hypothetical protein